jgi:hypothetical protein
VNVRQSVGVLVVAVFAAIGFWVVVVETGKAVHARWDAWRRRRDPARRVRLVKDKAKAPRVGYAPADPKEVVTFVIESPRG